MPNVPPAPAASATSPSVTNSLSTPANTPAQQFYAKVLSDAGLPVTTENINFLQGWSQAEGTSAKNNPLATSWTSPDIQSSKFNSSGVQNYASPSAGALATARTLSNGLYPYIMDALKSGNAVGYLYNNVGGNATNIYGNLNGWASNGQGKTESSYVRNVLSGIGDGGNAAIGGPFGSYDLGSTASAAGSAIASATGLSGITSWADAVEKGIEFVFSIRFLEILGGIALVGMGLFLIAKDLGLPTPTNLPGPAKQATDSAGDLSAAFEEGVAQGNKAQAKAAGRRSVVSGSPSEGSETRYYREKNSRAAEYDAGDIPF